MKQWEEPDWEKEQQQAQQLAAGVAEPAPPALNFADKKGAVAPAAVAAEAKSKAKAKAIAAAKKGGGVKVEVPSAWKPFARSWANAKYGRIKQLADKHSAKAVIARGSYARRVVCAVDLWLGAMRDATQFAALAKDPDALVPEGVDPVLLLCELYGALVLAGCELTLMPPVEVGEAGLPQEPAELHAALQVR